MQGFNKSYLIIGIALMMMIGGCTRKFASQNGDTKNIQISASNQSTINNEDKKSEKYLQKIRTIKERTTKYNKSLDPPQKSNINNDIVTLLHDILLETDSIKATSEEIIGTNKDFYLKFSKDYFSDNSKYRIIEFGSKEKDMGTSIDLYVQCLRDDKVISAEKIYNAVHGPNLTEMKYYGITFDDGKAYLTLLDEFYGPEYPLLRLYSYVNEGSKWIPNNNFEDINNEYWKSEKRSDIIIIKSDKVKDDSKADFDITSDKDELQLKIKDKSNNSILDSKVIILNKGKFKLH